MKNTKLIQLLKSFSKEEIKEFGNYLESPFSKSSNYILNFYKEIKKCYPQFNEDDIDRQNIFSRLYKNKQYSDGTMRSISSSLITEAEHYLSYKRFRNDNSYSDYCLLYELRIRELNDYFEIRSKQMLKDFYEKSKFDLGNFLYEFMIETEITGFKLYNGKKIEANENIKNLGDTLLIYFLAFSTISMNYISLVSTFSRQEIKSLINENFFPNFNYDAFIESLKEKRTHKAKYLEMNYYAFNLQINKDRYESFEKLRDLWYNSKDFLSDSLRKSYFDCLGNFCIVENRKSESPYVREFFNLSKVMLEENLFLTDTNILHFNTFRQIIRHSLRLKEFEWTEKFIDNYSVYLADEVKEMLLDTALAELAFELGDFEKSLEYLRKVKNETPSLKLDIKELYIKIFYELNYIDSVYSAIDSLRHFLNTTESILQDSIINAKNFLNFLSKLLKIKERNNISELKILKQEIDSNNNIHNKIWLLKICTEIMQQL